MLAAAAASGVLAALLCAAPSHQAQLPEGFKRCVVDAGFDECLADALGVALHQLAPGVPSFGIPPMDPLLIPQLIIGQNNRNRPVNLNINLTNLAISGLRNAKPTNIKIDIEKYKFACKGESDMLLVEADYVMDGRILVLPITGNGRVRGNLTNLRSNLAMDGEMVTKKGKRHMKVTKFGTELYGLEKLSLHFENLFNGDKTLGESTNTLINENWRDLWAEIKPPLEETLQYVFHEFARRIFDKVAYDDIFLPVKN